MAVPARPAQRRWILCADDYAIDAAAVEAILALIDQGRLTATSCLVDSPLWASAAAPLAAAAAGGRADLGLHLNLTQALVPDQPGVWPLGELIVRAATGLLPRAPVQSAVRRQLDAFEKFRGVRPDYIDGHQHAHQFAVVRDVLVQELQSRYGADAPWLRSTRPPPTIADRKARGIALLGERPLRARAAAAGLRVSTCLVGVYDFRAGSDEAQAAYLRHVDTWLQAGPDGAVLMCHPATRVPDGDPIGPARRMEFGFLGSAQFAAALAGAGIRAVTGSAWFASAGA